MALSSGFSGCIGFLDGTDVVLNYRPTIDGETYFNRKKRYAFNVQLICDDKNVIRWATIGWPGSVNDSTIYKTMPQYLTPAQYFEPSQYLLTDSCYESGIHTLPPYKAPAAAIPRNELFNELLARERVRIEHVNGVLKERFSSLRGIRTQINRPNDIESVVDWIRATVILYNVTLKTEAAWDYEYNPDDDEPAADRGSHREQNRRLDVQKLVLQYHNLE